MLNTPNQIRPLATNELYNDQQTFRGSSNYDNSYINFNI